MVALFVDESANAEGGKGVEKRKGVVLQGRQMSVKHRDAEIFDVNIYGIKKEQALKIAKARRVVEDSRHIHKKRGKDAPEVLYIAEKYEKCGEDKSDTDIEYDQANYRENEAEKAERKRHAVDYTEYKKDSEGKTEVDK